MPYFEARNGPNGRIFRRRTQKRSNAVAFAAVINGVHAVVFSEDADRTRAFFRDTLGLESVDAGGGWLIFALPPAELAAHPTDGAARHQLYLMCDHINATIEELKGKGADIAGPVSDQGWGRITTLTLPGGTEFGLYEPRHPTAHP
jgi:predicted enzyme related to lactoylglutathione lyase